MNLFFTDKGDLIAFPKQEEPPKTPSSVNQQFIDYNSELHRFKIYDAAQPLPYELSDEYLKGKKQSE